MREFPDKARAADLGDPATDLPLTLRVHPDDRPMDPAARRVIKTDQPGDAAWLFVTGSSSWFATWTDDEQVADWPYTSGVVAGAAFLPGDEHRRMSRDPDAGTVTCLCGDTAAADGSYDAAEWWREHRRQARNTAAQAAERGDMGVESFKGEVE